MNLSELERDLGVKFVCPNSLYFKDMVFHGDSGCPKVIDLTPKRAYDVASSVNLTNSVVEVRNVRLEDDTLTGDCVVRKPYWNDAPFWSSEVPDTISFAPRVFGELYETRKGI